MTVREVQTPLKSVVPAAAASRDRATPPGSDAQAFREALARADEAAQSPRAQRREARPSERLPEAGGEPEAGESLRPSSRSEGVRAAGQAPASARDRRTQGKRESSLEGEHDASPQDVQHADAGSDQDGSADAAAQEDRPADGVSKPEKKADAGDQPASPVAKGDQVDIASLQFLTPGVAAPTASAGVSAGAGAGMKQAEEEPPAEGALVTPGGAPQGESGALLAVKAGESESAKAGKIGAESAKTAGNTSKLSAPGEGDQDSAQEFSARLLGALGERAQGPNSPSALETDAAKAQAEAQASGPSARELDANVARVARGLQSAVQHNGGAVTLRLDPPEMGVVRVLMEVREGVASVQFRVEKESAGTLLNQHVESLRESLQRQGLNAERIDVQLMPRSPEPTGQGGQGAGQTPDEGRSRGQFAGNQESSRERGREPSPHGGEEPRSFEQALVNLVG